MGMSLHFYLFIDRPWWTSNKWLEVLGLLSQLLSHRSGLTIPLYGCRMQCGLPPPPPIVPGVMRGVSPADVLGIILFFGSSAKINNLNLSASHR